MTKASAELIELAERVEALTGPDREVDAEIGRFAAAEFLGYVPDRPQHGCQSYTASLDAAMSLYIQRPVTISSCPRKVTADAIRQRASFLGKGSERRAR